MATNLKDIQNYLLLTICLGFFVGCEAPRDMPTDPRNAPFLISQDITYQEGKVSIRWEYMGLDPVSRFRLVRLEREGLHPLEWVTAQLTRDVSPRSDVWEMQDAIDAKLNAGESYAYFIRAENVHGALAEGLGGNVQIPGATVENVSLDILNGTATINWQTQAGVPIKFELFRQVGNAPSEQIFQTADMGETRFVDGITLGNRAYRYWVRNFLNNDVVLDSRTMQLWPYLRNGDYNVIAPVGAYASLAQGQAFGQPLIMLTATQNEMALQKLNFFGTAFLPIALPVPNQSALQPASVSLAVTPTGQPRSPHVLVTGVLPDEKRVQLSAFTILGDIAIEAPWDNAVWSVENGDVKTAITVAADDVILVIAGTELRLYVPNTDGIQKGGVLDLGLPSAVHQVIAFDEGVWVVLQDGRVWRSPPVWDAQGRTVAPMWTSVEGITQAVGIGQKDGIIYVVDGTQNQVKTFNFEGQAGLWWDGMDDLNLGDVALSVALNGDVYMRDANGKLAVFQRPFTNLELLPTEGE